MSRIQQLFAKKSRSVLNVYCTAGFPRLDSTLAVMQSLQQHGADLIELGMPYSDPLADGEVIQQSSAVALGNGMTIAVLFEQLRTMRERIHIPVILMGYMNPVLQYGFEKFCADAQACGIDGLILPDLPAFEFEREYGAITRKYGLDFIFLVTPETPPDRVKQLDALSSGFLYAVSSSSTTGAAKNMVDVEGFLQRLNGYGLKNPILVGFGIKDGPSFRAACRHARGAIIGTAYIRTLQGAADVDTATAQFLQDVLG